MTTDDDNSLIAERRAKLAALRAQGVAFPNDFRPQHHAADLRQAHEGEANEVLEPKAIHVVVAGRLMLKRVMGKAAFGTLQDGSGRIQIYVTATSSAARARCSAPRPASCRSAPRPCGCSSRACARCPTSSTA
jgi:lysyl-tRNA synthetase class II